MPNSPWFEQTVEPKQYDPKWRKNKLVPKGLEFNCKVSKQQNNKLESIIDRTIGTITPEQLNSQQLCLFKCATVKEMAIQRGNIGKL